MKKLDTVMESILVLKQLIINLEKRIKELTREIEELKSPKLPTFPTPKGWPKNTKETWINCECYTCSEPIKCSG